MRILPLLVVLSGALLAVGAQDTLAQRSHRSSGGGGRSGDSVAERAKRAEGLIVMFDANRDGVIEPNEVHGQSRYVYERMAKEAGLDPTHSLSVAELRTAVARYFEKLSQGGDKSKAPTGPESSSAKPSTSGGPAAPVVNGFGAAGEKAAVSGFTTSPPNSSSGASSGASRPSTSGFASSPSGENKQLDPRIRKYAESLLKRYDANKNGVLEKDEWKDMRGSPEEGDANHDSVITLDELTNRLATYGRKSSSSSSTSSASTTSSSDSSSSGSPGSHGGSGSSTRSRGRWGSPPRETSSSPDERKSYRFLSPTERLPKGLPDWFARKDADGDGQVSMAEYSSLWDDAKAAEFDGFDLNHDGVITPEECLQGETGK